MLDTTRIRWLIGGARRGHRWITLLVLGIAWAGTADAQTLELTERAYESTLGDVGLPSSTVGTLTLRACATCEPVSLQVSPDTAYIAPDGPMTLRDFLVYVDNLRQSPETVASTYVAVFRSLADGRVTRVKLDTAD
jgi:hypothetical protein